VSTLFPLPSLFIFYYRRRLLSFLHAFPSRDNNFLFQTSLIVFFPRSSLSLFQPAVLFSLCLSPFFQLSFLQRRALTTIAFFLDDVHDVFRRLLFLFPGRGASPSGGKRTFSFLKFASIRFERPTQPSSPLRIGRPFPSQQIVPSSWRDLFFQLRSPDPFPMADYPLSLPG